jgi:predicted translin family RNA/ssDNA-binding protein
MNIFADMLDKKDFKEIRDEFNSFDDNRELVIKKSRDILKLSKQIIYSVHRDDLKEAAELVKGIENEKKKIEKIISKNSKLESIGAYRVAIGEYAEAMLYYHFIKSKKIPTHKSLKVTPEHYLLGLIDLTGELGRKAVQLAGKGNFKEVVLIRDIVSEIYGELLKFDFRESEMRKKFDSVKYDLKKLEDLVLDLKLKGKL